ncbi:DNA polymerase III, subunits gamma and tau [Rubrobacter xylanophilus DSM 9941]|uniref:DNA polymerase III subunit gamma/tau n=1 Tax=Rubrobacter xylanophilus (strain DSM 9941 / JCM 11954 / NBRC 16129 / PRD-1) TaxID=266117 RepID=Q1ATA7_RUBXD|nr:DNA polymerase III subunit gamma/tau [Rubrobacter xylanophilus]ABG05371.1 DNA polymerase III, subunits gamma and tau [Rubrobacter xylanophilus DSM 9941]
MKHATLYRRWRPRTFGEIAGQEPVVRTLRRAIETGRVAHAYLFSGPRGTGKTSTAKVLAMGLNCAQGPTPEPCGRCESCRSIVAGSSMDVIEMDAASNRGIDEIRELRDRVNLAPAAGRAKVYIIDEVHMLTTEAFNALLKMLEEPPEHVVFVLATTEKHKVLPTIISRCQSFDFRRPGVGTLVEKLSEIARAEGIEAEREALTAIARASGGSFRDAEGMLDQISSFSEGRVTVALVRELLGSAGPEMLAETADALHERRAADALRVVDRLSSEGRDLGQFAAELISHLRVLMLLPHAPEAALAEAGPEERPALEEQARRIPTGETVRMIEALGETSGRIRRGGDPKLELELCFLKLARDYTEPSLEGLVRRVEALEKRLEEGSAPPRENPAKESPEQPPDGRAGEAPPRQEEPPRTGAELDWDSVLQELRARRQVPVAALYESARVEGCEDGLVKISFPEELAPLMKSAGEPKRVEPLRDVLEERLGFRPRVELKLSGEAPPRPPAAYPPSPEPARREGEDAPRAQERPHPPREGPEGEEDVIRSQDEVFELARRHLGGRPDARGG